MRVTKDAFEIRKIHDVPGAMAPVYIIGLPQDLDKLEEELEKNS